MLIDIGLFVGTYYLVYKAVDKTNIADVITRSSKKELTEYDLVIGYSGKVFKKPIVVNMKSTPHLLCCGLSGQGKSRCIEYAVKGKDVVLLNAFEDDFQAIKGRRIIGNANILKYLESLTREPYKREKPLYIVIDEMLSCCIDKKISEAIKNLLSFCRHMNIYIIGISVRGNKSDLSFKDLFNCRMTFRQVESSAYSTILGYSVEDKRLNKREFILASDDLYKGMTYDV